jgi:hypothetical protein
MCFAEFRSRYAAGDLALARGRVRITAREQTEAEARRSDEEMGGDETCADDRCGDDIRGIDGRRSGDAVRERDGAAEFRGERAAGPGRYGDEAGWRQRVGSVR